MLIVLYNFIVAYRKIFIYIRATVDIAFRAMLLCNLYKSNRKSKFLYFNAYI